VSVVLRNNTQDSVTPDERLSMLFFTQMGGARAAVEKSPGDTAGGWELWKRKALRQ
jgi:hypothetical protein